MMLKSKSTTDIPTQTDSSCRQYGIIATLFYKENKKQEPCRQHSTMLSKVWIILKEIKFYKKMKPKNPGIAKQWYPKIREQPPKKYPK